MKKVMVYEVLDGTQYRTRKEALQALEEERGAILVKMASEISNLGGKYMNFLNWLDENFQRFERVIALSEDKELMEEASDDC